MGTEIQFSPGNHSFLGALKFKVVSGDPHLHGAILHAGFADTLFFPSHSLPWTFTSASPFTLAVEEVPSEYFCSLELGFYYPPATFSNFASIFPNLFHSETFPPLMYPSNCIEKLSQILEGPSSLSFIAGDQGSGKSHFSRFLSNSIISRHGLVYYVDLDCGQPEMSLPGVVSLTACRSFLLSAPEQQLFRPDQRMFFAGGLRTDRLTYFQAVLRILDSIPRDACAVINSNGYLWGEAGIGFQRDLITLLKPDHVFFLHSGGGPEILTESQLNVEISRLPSLAPPASQKVKRTLRIAGYFLRGKPPMIVQQPVTVPVRSVRFGLPLDEFFDYFEVPSIFSGSLVYLCIDERQFRPIQKLVTIVKQISAVQVKGFGFVKAIDLEHKVIYIVTPVDVSDINLLCYIPLDIPAIFYGESPCCQHTYIDLREVVI